MTSFHLVSNIKQRRQFVQQLKANDNGWPDEVFEDIVGIPDVLNEKLANARANAILARVKL